MAVAACSHARSRARALAGCAVESKQEGSLPEVFGLPARPAAHVTISPPRGEAWNSRGSQTRTGSRWELQTPLMSVKAGRVARLQCRVPPRRIPHAASSGEHRYRGALAA